MAHRKWKETKQQPSLLPGPAVPGSVHFLWAILCPQAVQGWMNVRDSYSRALEQGTLPPPPPPRGYNIIIKLSAPLEELFWQL